MGSKLKIHAKPDSCKLINKHALQVIFQVKKKPNGHCKKKMRVTKFFVVFFSTKTYVSTSILFSYCYAYAYLT